MNRRAGADLRPARPAPRRVRWDGTIRRPVHRLIGLGEPYIVVERVFREGASARPAEGRWAGRYGWRAGNAIPAAQPAAIVRSAWARGVA